MFKSTKFNAVEMATILLIDSTRVSIILAPLALNYFLHLMDHFSFEGVRGGKVDEFLTN